MAIFSICLIATLAISMIDSINATTHTIDPKTPGGIQGAVGNASDGDTIYLKNGVYSGENNIYVKIDKSITIKGTGSNVILDGRGDIITISGKEKPGNIFWFYTLTGKPVSSATFENLKFRNTERPKALGAVIETYSKCDKLTVKNCVFTNNKVRAIGYGGHYGKTNSLTVTNCVFQGNKATVQNGGAIDYVGKGSLTVKKCTFNNNDARHGGAISYIGDGTLTVDKSTFKNNKVIKGKYTVPWGGAISATSYMKNTNTVKITNSKFEKNTAEVGGAIKVSLSKSKVTVTGCTFTNNKATKKSYGGAICIGYDIKSSQQLTCKITNSKFTKNIAGNTYNAIYKHKKVKLSKKNVKITPKDGSKVKK